MVEYLEYCESSEHVFCCSYLSVFADVSEKAGHSALDSAHHLGLWGVAGPSLRDEQGRGLRGIELSGRTSIELLNLAMRRGQRDPLIQVFDILPEAIAYGDGSKKTRLLEALQVGNRVL